MHDDETHALRRFCYIISAALLVVLVVSLLGMLFVRELPYGAFLLLSFVILPLLIFLQNKMLEKFKKYLDTGLRYYLKRFGICFCMLLVGFIIYTAGKLTSDMSFMFIAACWSIYLLLDIIHVLGKIRCS